MHRCPEGRLPALPQQRSRANRQFELLYCDACLDRIVEAEDAGGSWRSSYLFPHRLVDAEGDQMLRFVSTLLPRLGHDAIRPCELPTDPPPPRPPPPPPLPPRPLP